eukprot:jgi/Chlat1/6352/Chrsp44S05910
MAAAASVAGAPADLAGLDYIVVLDLEATQDDTGLREIGCVSWGVVDMQTASMVDQKQLLVRPDWIRTQDPALLNAGSLHETVQQLDNYLYSSFGPKSFSLATATSAPMHELLRPEASGKEISLAPHYGQYINIIAEFRICYPQAPPQVNSLQAMLECHVFRRPDKEDVEMDPAATSAALAAREKFGLPQTYTMNGADRRHVFRRPDKEDVEMDPAATSAALAAREKFGLPQTYTMNGADRRGSFDRHLHVVRLRGLPYSATEEDIMEFFKGLEIVPNGIILGVTAQGRATGEAFVEFANEQDVASAVERNRQMMGRRYVEVFRSSHGDMQHAAKRGGYSPRPGAAVSTSSSTAAGYVAAGHPDPAYEGVVRMRGLPYSATLADVYNFFSGLEIVPDGIYLLTTPDGRFSGEAYVEFSSEDHAHASVSRHMQRIGSRYIEVFRSNKGDMLEAMRQRGAAPAAYGASQLTYGAGQVPAMGPGMMAPGVSGVGGENAVLKLRGLPFSATEMDLAAFFEGYGVVMNGIQLVYSSYEGRGEGRPTGEAFAEFVSPAEAARALRERDRKNVGSRYVEIFRSSKSEMLAAIGATGMVPVMDPNMVIMMQQQGMPPTPMGIDPAMAQYQMQMAAQAWGPQGGGRGQRYQGGSQRMDESQATVRMRGLPYRCTVSDIMEFFKDFSVIPDSIKLRTRADGSPSGEASVTFDSAEEARNAVRKKNRDTIGNRYIELF